MFKVSFKETELQPSRVVIKAGRDTTVTLKGRMKTPHFWHLMPDYIHEWIANQTRIELYENMSDDTIMVFSEGHSKCRKDDRYDSLLGERLAESRAKMGLYQFFYTLCDKLDDYFQNIMFGSTGVAANGKPGSLTYDLLKYEKLVDRERHHYNELLNANSNGRAGSI